jgi:Protein of unknown function (DUF664)
VPQGDACTSFLRAFGGSHVTFSRVRCGSTITVFTRGTIVNIRLHPAAEAGAIMARRESRTLHDTRPSQVMHPSPLRLEPIPGYTPTIGRLVGMLTYARSTTVAAVEGLTVAELDHLHDAHSNSIGALLAHIVAVERSYPVMTFEDRGFLQTRMRNGP